MMHITTTHPEGVYLYMIFSILAAVLGICISAFAAHKNKIDLRVFFLVISAGALMSIIGSKIILYNLSDWEMLFFQGIMPSENAKSVLGAVLGGILGVWITIRLTGTQTKLFDSFVIAAPVALAVQRIGCLVSGCCHGLPTTAAWGITYGPGSKVYQEHMELGLIREDALSSLSIHPNQVYNIVAYLLILAIIVILKNRLKSPAGTFLFSVILFLGVRFLEDFFRYHPVDVNWMGITLMQWKLLIAVILLSFLLRYREIRHGSKVNLQEGGIHSVANPGWQLLIVSAILILMAILIESWLTTDEKVIIAITLIPLCFLLMAEFLIALALSRKFRYQTCLIALGCVLMSQTHVVKGPTPKSYTSFELKTLNGQFNAEHGFNYQNQPGTDCDGNPTLVGVKEKFTYKHVYKMLGFGVNRKIYYNDRQSLQATLNIYTGKESEQPYSITGAPFLPPHFENSLFAINPMIQYDAQHIGLGLGVSFGILGYDETRDEALTIDYEPNQNQRTATIQTRLRLFNEQKLFFEILGGYDAASAGDYTWQVLAGSRFNSTDWMLKGGLGWSSHGTGSFAMQAQIPISKRFTFSPGFMTVGAPEYGTPAYGENIKKGIRASMSLEYKLQGQAHRRKK